MLHDALNCQKHLPLSTSFHASIMQHVHLQLHYRHHPTQAFTGLPPRRSLLPTPIGSTHRLCIKINTCSNRTHTSILQNNFKNVKRCRDGNVCEAYVIPFLFGSFFTVCHPYIDVHFLKCFFCYLLLIGVSEAEQDLVPVGICLNCPKKKSSSHKIACSWHPLSG